MSKKKIQELACELKVPYLVHFTRSTNLESIMNSGIHSVQKANELGIDAIVNDTLRLDGQPDSVSISIAFPNCQMLYKYRMENPETKWAILVLNPSILWTKECAFCKHNAADARITSQPTPSLRTIDAFRGMFEEIPGLPTRAEQKIKSYDPTDVQAEILSFETIEPELIHGVAFDSQETKDQNIHLFVGRKAVVHANNKGLFATRNYVRKFN